MLKKKEFIELLAEKGYTRKDSAVITDDFLNTVAEILADGDSVMFHGFGTFGTVEKAARKSVDFQSKKEILLPSYRTPKFKAGKILKRSVCSVK